MDGTAFTEAVREDEATALDRLGSDKYLIAATGADLSAPAVLATVATTAASGRDTFAAWADGASDPAATAFAAAAETEAAAYDRVAEALTEEGADPPEADPGGAVHRALQAADDDIERAAAMVGRGLVCDRARLQVVNFFVNEAAEGRAALARELRSDADDQVADGAALLERLCDDGGDWDRAVGIGRGVVSAAYDEYADRLEAMGVDPKPVC